MGLFDGIFGKGPKLDLGPANTYMSTLGNIANRLGSQYDATSQDYSADNARNRTAINEYSRYLMADPATDQYNAEQTANAERYAANGAARATAGFQQQLAQRGINPNSSIGVGGLANIQQGLAANNANIQAQIGEDNRRQHGVNLATNANLWNATAGNSFNRANTLSTQQAAIDGNLLSEADQMAMQKYQDEIAQQASSNQFLSTLGTAAFPLLKGFNGGKAFGL